MHQNIKIINQLNKNKEKKGVNENLLYIEKNSKFSLFLH